VVQDGANSVILQVFAAEQAARFEPKAGTLRVLGAGVEGWLTLGSEAHTDHMNSQNYMRKTPKLPLSRSLGSQLFIATDKPKPSTERVSEGAITPSSHRRAEV